MDAGGGPQASVSCPSEAQDGIRDQLEHPLDGCEPGQWLWSLSPGIEYGGPAIIPFKLTIGPGPNLYAPALPTKTAARGNLPRWRCGRLSGIRRWHQVTFTSGSARTASQTWLAV